MKQSSLDRPDELNKKFTSLLVLLKKLKALDNFTLGGKFKHKEYLGLLKICLTRHFPDKNEREFIDYLLETYRINFLEWSHRTPYIKRQIQKMVADKQPAESQFDLFDKDPAFNRQALKFKSIPKRSYVRL